MSIIKREMIENKLNREIQNFKLAGIECNFTKMEYKHLIDFLCWNNNRIGNELAASADPDVISGETIYRTKYRKMLQTKKEK